MLVTTATLYANTAYNVSHYSDIIFQYRAAKLWNSLPLDIVRCMSLFQFKTRVHDWLTLADENNFI